MYEALLWFLSMQEETVAFNNTIFIKFLSA